VKVSIFLGFLSGVENFDNVKFMPERFTTTIDLNHTSLHHTRVRGTDIEETELALVHFPALFATIGTALAVSEGDFSDHITCHTGSI
jgi:hypothetical protein